MIGIPTPTVDPSGNPVTCTFVSGSAGLVDDGDVDGEPGLVLVVVLPLLFVMVTVLVPGLGCAAVHALNTKVRPPTAAARTAVERTSLVLSTSPR
jgi:hypothetical protein